LVQGRMEIHLYPYLSMRISILTRVNIIFFID
jgi:hypothetical protein